MVSFIISKQGNFLRALSQKFSVRINIDHGKDVHCVYADEEVCQIKGKLKNVQYTIVFILRRAHEYTLLRPENYTEMIKMLIPNNFVTKLIGASNFLKIKKKREVW